VSVLFNFCALDLLMDLFLGLNSGLPNVAAFMEAAGHYSGHNGSNEGGDDYSNNKAITVIAEKVFARVCDTLNIFGHFRFKHGGESTKHMWWGPNSHNKSRIFVLKQGFGDYWSKSPGSKVISQFEKFSQIARGYQMFFFLLVILSIFGFNEASKEAIDISQFPSFFSNLHSSLLSGAPILEDDFNTTQSYYDFFPLQTLAAVNGRGSNDFNYYIMYLSNCSYSGLTKYQEILIGATSQEVFDMYNMRLTDLLLFPKYDNKDDLEYKQKLIEMIMTILKGFNFPNEVINVFPVRLKKSSILLSDYIKSFEEMAKFLKYNLPVGLQQTYLQLSKLYSETKGEISAESKIKMYSLIYAFAFYSDFIFRLRHIACLEVDKTDPQMLSIIIGMSFKRQSPETIFSQFGPNSIIGEVVNYLDEHFVQSSLVVYGFDHHPHPKSTFPFVLKELTDVGLVHFKAYLKLHPLSYPNFSPIYDPFLGSTQIEPFFYYIYYKYVLQGPLEIFSNTEFIAIRDNFNSHLQECLEMVESIGNKEFSGLYIHMVLCENYEEYQTKMAKTPLVNLNVQKIFVLYNRLINEILYRTVKEYSTRKEEDRQKKRLIGLILSILKRVDYSHDTIISIEINYMSKAKCSTKLFNDCIEEAISFFFLYDNISGYSLAYKQLEYKTKLKAHFKSLSVSYEDSVSIYSLIFSCAYFSNNDYILLDPETTRPLDLAFLLIFQLQNETPKGFFMQYKSDNLIIDALDSLEYQVIKGILQVYGIETPEALIKEIPKGISDRDAWLVKVYGNLKRHANQSKTRY
jgi:hypothetical protein